MDRCNDNSLAWDGRKCPVPSTSIFGLTEREFIDALMRGQHPIDDPIKCSQHISILETVQERKHALKYPEEYWDTIIDNLVDAIYETVTKKKNREAPWPNLADPKDIIDAEALLRKLDAN